MIGKRVLVCALLPVASFQAHAALDFYDSFNYSPAAIPLATAAAPTWVLYTGSGPGPTNTAGSLSYPGLQTATGDNSVLFNGAGAFGTAARNLSQLYNIGNGPTLYYSLTLQVTTISGNDWGGSGNWVNGAFMLGFDGKLKNGTPGFALGEAAAPLLIRTGNPSNVGGTADTFQGYQLGVGVTAIPTQRIFDAAHVYDPGDTLFLVLSYTFNAGANNDIAKLYVNPIPGSIESANVPVATATGFLEVTNNQIQSFFLGNNSMEPNGTQIDDLRVGTTWQDVTPASVPEPSRAMVIGLGALGLMLIRRFRH